MAVHIVEQRARIGESTANWPERLPVLRGARVVLREVRASDATALLALVTPPEVSRYISPPPATVPTFERFIARARAQQAVGAAAIYVVTLQGSDSPIGLFQIRQLEPNFRTAEWGFALGSAFWGTGLFEECADLVLAFAFGVLGAHRVEARAAVRNGRGNRALQKLGAVQEGVLRQAFLCGGEYVDQILYAIVEDDWRSARAFGSRPTRVVVH